jgi:putative FmdB family regulatory protein
MYDYKCSVCKRGRSVFLKLADINSSVFCQHCGFSMNRQISAPFVRGDLPAYECPVTGRMIEGRRAHEENLKQTGCRIWEPGETAERARKRAEADAKLESAIEETADQFIAGLPTEKRDRLAAEMEGGLTAQVERSTPNFNQ